MLSLTEIFGVIGRRRYDECTAESGFKLKIKRDLDRTAYVPPLGGDLIRDVAYRKRGSCDYFLDERPGHTKQEWARSRSSIGDD
jgi:hypothetical protein